ncbi:hypothetical protein EST38_g5494 [Candolleomyces aberdarensis]|uniref:Uncharacterized protein n=1 Tax=Candolleomyces aberdarensis TaxID=2316362 RepID=A0A4Q2DK94_9AGAR|nr:hypothetical protein EST38_g5494 [Candolleomyces aberdarensis]
MDSQYTAPLVKALPYLKASLSFSYQASIYFLRLARLMVPIPMILYILAPFTVFFGYIGHIFIFAPYSTLVYLLDALHPLYVFCGVACLTGLLVGWIGRTVARLFVGSVAYSEPSEGTADVVKKEGEEPMEL